MVVAGYVVMRIALVALWIRAAKQDPARRSICLSYAVMLSVSQIGWIAIMIPNASLPVTFLLVGLMTVVELSGPWLVETRKGSAPWHAHHIAERYGLLTIITLGEGVVGTVASLSAAVTTAGWSVDAVLLAAAGVGLTFGMWWMYFEVPTSHLLHADRRRAIRFGYSHIPVVRRDRGHQGGLHAAAYYIDHHSALSSVGPSSRSPSQSGSTSARSSCSSPCWSADGTATPTAGADRRRAGGRGGLAAAGVSMPVCLLIITLAPMVNILGFELFGHRHAVEVRSTGASPRIALSRSRQLCSALSHLPTWAQRRPLQLSSPDQRRRRCVTSLSPRARRASPHLHGGRETADGRRRAGHGSKSRPGFDRCGERPDRSGHRCGRRGHHRRGQNVRTRPFRRQEGPQSQGSPTASTNPPNCSTARSTLRATGTAPVAADEDVPGTDLCRA